MQRDWIKAWLLCGSLDALYATAMTLVRGGSAAKVWQGVASGPFGEGTQHWGAGAVVAGLLVHFAIMAAMVTVAMQLAHRTVLGRMAPSLAGPLYGLALYGVMYGIVLPLRFGVPFPNPDKVKVLTALVPHVLLVGMPMFYLFRKKRLLS